MLTVPMNLEHFMSSAVSPARSLTFRLITIAACGLGSFVLALWGLSIGFSANLGDLPEHVLIAAIAGLCTLAAAGAAMSFFAGVGESLDYVVRETHFDKATGLLTRTAMIGKIAEAVAQTKKTGEPVFLIDIEIGRF